MVQKIRGMQDNYFEDAEKRQALMAEARVLLALYGYRQIETPIIEFTELFRRSTGEYTDIVSKEMYSFPDSKGRSQSLRPEGTPTVVRAMIEDSLHSKYGLPLKFYYIGPMFRHERPQKGRYRQHTQIGAELFGAAGVEADLEVMSLSFRLLEELGLDGVELLFNSLGCSAPECRPRFVKSLVDFFSSREKDLCDNCRARLRKNPLRLLDCKNEKCRPVINEAPSIRGCLCGDCGERWSGIERGLKEIGVNARADDKLVRGLDYYTGVVWELQSGAADAELAQSALGGGGRYDNLVAELGGPDIPALGFSCGVERISMSLLEGQPLASSKGICAYIIAMGGGETNDSLAYDVSKLVDKLRGDGVKVIWEFSKSALKKQLHKANELKATHAIIIGPEEHGQKVVQVKDLAARKQRTVAWKALGADSFR